MGIFHQKYQQKTMLFVQITLIFCLIVFLTTPVSSSSNEAEDFEAECVITDNIKMTTRKLTLKSNTKDKSQNINLKNLSKKKRKVKKSINVGVTKAFTTVMPMHDMNQNQTALRDRLPSLSQRLSN